LKFFLTQTLFWPLQNVPKNAHCAKTISITEIPCLSLFLSFLSPSPI
jgi:hypothetical protein